jgi:hypothetical protein
MLKYAQNVIVLTGKQKLVDTGGVLRSSRRNSVSWTTLEILVLITYAI